MPCSSPFQSAKRIVRRGRRPSAWICRATSRIKCHVAAVVEGAGAEVPRVEVRADDHDLVGLLAAADLADHVGALVGLAALDVDRRRQRETPARTQQAQGARSASRAPGSASAACSSGRSRRCGDTAGPSAARPCRRHRPRRRRRRGARPRRPRRIRGTGPRDRRSSSVATSTNAPLAEAPSRAKSASAPVPPSTSGAVNPAAGVAAENGIAAARKLEREFAADAGRGRPLEPQRRHRERLARAPRRPASRKRARPHSIARRFASEPVGRPPISSVSDWRSRTSGVSPSRAAASRAESSAEGERRGGQRRGRRAGFRVLHGADSSAGPG